ncbi:BgtA-21327 [Blumeria graminis f. sp. tritici]|uniref:Patatin-like phospholipase domain-containing protein n=2 Tax=Blumeria graminis f. sp. tritici TaxID=62690 RepID=A0A9X9QFC3_BLUGR|nr:hypothetical protein BGT96224_A21327 [Blumeria graminis f. sp. tritici 96224]VDB92857.1 BgtA-21327 [Blumeria graminis f. sp. tritici]
MNTPSLCACSTPTSTTLRDQWNILGSAARALRNSAELLNRTLLGLRTDIDNELQVMNTRKNERRQALLLRLHHCVSAEQWKATAKELDILEDNEAWKADNMSDEFDAPLIETRLRQLDEAREARDVKQMLSLVRTALSRDLGGMGNVCLYTRSYIGTKYLIERYIDSTLATIRLLVEISRSQLPEDIEISNVLQQVLNTRQAFGRSALLLSGGGTFGMNHIGVLKALFNANCLPRIISGSSAGSIVCSVLCSRTDAEIPSSIASFAHGDLAVFEDDDRPDGVLGHIERLLTQGAWIDNKHLIRVMQDLLGDMTFQEAYNRTRRILNICVSSASVYELPRLLNYITSPNVMIWSAVAASCSVPMVFAAASLLIKNPLTGENLPWNPTPQQWIDGSVDGDLPMTRLAEMFNVNHFIVSQVNPHVVPFLVNEERSKIKYVQRASSPGWMSTLTKLAKDEALHRLHMLAEFGICPNVATKLNSVLSQKYSGDITILPQVELKDFPLILTNPTPEFMEKAMLCGERATWPKLSRIRNSCAVELELDSAVRALRARVVFGASQPDLRDVFTAKYQRLSSVTRPKRGYSINHVDLKQSIVSDEEDHLYMDEKKSPRQALVLRVPPRISCKNSSASVNQLKYMAPYTSIDSYNDSSFSETISISRRFHEGGIESSADSNTKRESHSTPLPSPPAFDYFSSSHLVTTGSDHILATSPLMKTRFFSKMSSVSPEARSEMTDLFCPFSHVSEHKTSIKLGSATKLFGCSVSPHNTTVDLRKAASDIMAYKTDMRKDTGAPMLSRKSSQRRYKKFNDSQVLQELSEVLPA